MLTDSGIGKGGKGGAGGGELAIAVADDSCTADAICFDMIDISVFESKYLLEISLIELGLPFSFFLLLFLLLFLFFFDSFILFAFFSFFSFSSFLSLLCAVLEVFFSSLEVLAWSPLNESLSPLEAPPALTFSS
jgi:hypothetical protein